MCSESEKIRIFVRDWLNKLEFDHYPNGLVLECLTSTNNALVKCSDFKSYDDLEADQQVIILLKKIIVNSELEWLSSCYSKSIVHEILSKLNPELTLMCLIDLLNDLKPGTRLDFAVGLLEQYFVHNSYEDLVLIQSHAETQVHQLTWNKLICCISSLPEHIANKFESKTSFPLFHHERFFIFIGLQIIQILETLVVNIRENKSIDVTFLANNVSQFCLRGKTEFLFKPLLPFLVAKTHNCFLWQRVAQKCFCKFTDRSLDKIILHFFKYAPSCHCLPLILGDLIVTNSKAKFIITHKLLLTHYSFECTVARNVVGYLASFPQTHFLYEALLKLLSVWSSSSAIKHTPYEQHRYLTAAIITCSPYLKDKLDSRYKAEITRGFMDGVKNHLESPDAKTRVLGMIVAENLSDLVKVSEQKEKLEFDYEKTDDVKFLLSLDSKEEDPNDEFYANQIKMFEDVKSKMESGPSNAISETTFAVDKRNFVKMAETQQINLQPLDTDREHESSPISSVVNDVDSDDDLVPYDMPEETPFSEVSKPMYIRDCMDGLIENKDREHVEIYLNCVDDLVDKDLFAAREIAVELCKVLMNMQDNYAISDFHLLRRKAVVSILVCDPKSVATYLANEFYNEYYNLQQRMDILDVLVMAAGRISGLEKDHKMQESASKEVESESNDLLPWKQVVEKRIESKTRRFGKVRKKIETSPDRFGPVAGCFFYPLMAGYDRRIRTLDLLGTDTMVLGRLLYALGTILYSAANSTVVEDMSMTLLQFTATVRGHAQSFVRKACIYCLTMITLSVRTLTQRLNDVTLDARDWLCDVIANDEDTQARQLASNCLALMSSKVREELAVDR